MQWLLMKDGVLVETFNVALGQDAMSYVSKKYDKKDENGETISWQNSYTLYAYACGKVPA